MSAQVLGLAATSSALLAAAVAGGLLHPTPRLGPRVRPYLLGRRSGFDPNVSAAPRDAVVLSAGGVAVRLFAPPLAAMATRLHRVLGGARDEQIALRLRRAGYREMTPDDYRLRVVGAVAMFGTAGVIAGSAVLGSAIGALGLGACGVAYGLTRWRGRIDRRITARRERIRLELYTVNHLLAIHVRTGAGPVQAVQRIVDRGTGVVAEELDVALTAMRSGAAEAETFRRAADLTAEPGAARTYRLLATGTEAGVDLGTALRALSEDLRDARRDEIRQTATRRRAAMLVPTIAVLAPVMLLFIAAPLPSIVLGGR